MTRDKMNTAIDLDRIIRGFSDVKADMRKGHWVRIETADHRDIYLGYFYTDFQIWIEKKLEEAKRLFEAL